jgi:hypothetical protein
MAAKKLVKRKPGAKVPEAAAGTDAVESASRGRLYTLTVYLLEGMVTEAFIKKHPVISRTLQIRGGQTLQDLHEALFDAFDREDEHLYEFQFGKQPMDGKARRYGLAAMAGGFEEDDGMKLDGSVEETTMDSLGLTPKSKRFWYWFDFGDDWWHAVDVDAVEEAPAKGKYPKLVKRVGDSPPQYPDMEDDG